MNLHVNHELALRLAADNVPTFPAQPDGPCMKAPCVSGGFHSATTAPPKIAALWSRYPGALVGIPTGPSTGVWVLDVDGDVGRESLNQILADLGFETPFDLTPVISRTPSGGLHLFFRLRPGERPRTRAGDIAPGLDTRGVKADGSDGGCVIAPGTVLPDGRRYELIEPGSLIAEGWS